MQAISPLNAEAERVSALIEEQALTKEQVVGYLRQIMEIRALENNISKLLDQRRAQGRLAPLCRPGSDRRRRRRRAAAG